MKKYYIERVIFKKNTKVADLVKIEANRIIEQNAKEHDIKAITDIGNKIIKRYSLKYCPCCKAHSK